MPYKSKQRREIAFFVRYKKQWRCARVCDYNAIRSEYITLRKAHYHVIHRPIITIKFNYPLDQEIQFTFCRLTGFTYLDLMACVYKGYCKIYKEVRKYGLWGHSISELYLEGFIINSPGDYELAIRS